MPNGATSEDAASPKKRACRTNLSLSYKIFIFGVVPLGTVGLLEN